MLRASLIVVVLTVVACAAQMRTELPGNATDGECGVEEVSVYALGME